MLYLRVSQAKLLFGRVRSGRITLVLFRTRRRDECSRLKESVRRRVRKSRQKEAAGAADAGPMQIEWSEAEGLKLGGVVKAAGVAAGAPVQRRVDGGSEPRQGQEEGVWGLWRQTSAKRWEARRECGG
jgi:hypothetical protein